MATVNYVEAFCDLKVQTIITLFQSYQLGQNKVSKCNNFAEPSGPDTGLPNIYLLLNLSFERF